ncbi:uncharacterized protein LOC142575202 isoform X2 [Dermacentor variabilis]|uniref:uncharacterized protein LOC142575202 isoform X2 n=1 Tax=Dermacentor variabilis TaxID=34621 RepID=UPI003F5AF6E8
MRISLAGWRGSENGAGMRRSTLDSGCSRARRRARIRRDNTRLQGGEAGGPGDTKSHSAAAAILDLAPWLFALSLPRRQPTLRVALPAAATN